MKPKNPNPPDAVDVDYYNTAPVFFDIETMPLERAEILEFLPTIKAPGQYKKPESIAAYIEEAKEEKIKKAALSPLTGRVLAIGVKTAGERGVFDYNDEKHTLKEFWKYFRHNNVAIWVGHNSNGFDWPFLIKRSWKHNITIPTGIKDGRWYRKNIQDTQEIFTGGAYGERIKLDTLAKYFGVGAKNGDGAFFSELYFADKAKAIDYLYNDLDLTQAVWERMQ